MIVRLTWSEMMIAHMVAGQRIVLNAKNGAKPKHGAPEGIAGDMIHVLSTRGEMVVAKAFNLYWSGASGDYKAVDVGGLIEVRTVPVSTHRLMLHPDDKELPTVLVDASRSPEFRLCGWLMGQDGKRQDWWEDPTGKDRPAFFVPHASLLPLKKLLMKLDEMRDGA